MEPRLTPKAETLFTELVEAAMDYGFDLGNSSFSSFGDSRQLKAAEQALWDYISFLETTIKERVLGQ